MRHWSQVVFLVLLLIQVEAQDGFIKTSGIHFMLNGSPYYANGFNAYWLMYVATDPTQRDKVSSAFQQASNHGLTVARTWGFSDGGYRALQYSPGSYNEQTFQGLDFVVSEAKRYGIKLILSLVDNYENFGGKKQYVDWARSQGQNLASDDVFFTNSVVKGYYKNRIKENPPYPPAGLKQCPLQRSPRRLISRSERGDYNLRTCPDRPRQAPLKLGLVQRESIEPTPIAG